MEIKAKKIWKLLARIVFVLVFGSGGAIVALYYVFPQLGLKNFKENVTVVKTEEVVVREDNQLNRIASQASNSVFTIVSFQFNSSKTGTGIILTNDGLAVSFRKSILEKGATYKAIASNGQIYDAFLEEIDEFTDLAYFKIKAENLTAVSFSNSEDYYPGKKLILVAPSGEDFQGRFSSAILSGFNRTLNISGGALSVPEKLEGVFDIDGESSNDFLGSAVVDYNGELSGILGSVKMDNQEKFFVIPVNDVKKSLELKLKNELDKRSYLGVYYVPLNKANSLIYKTDRDSGALIYSVSGKQGLAVIANSPADKAGIKIGDIITAVNESSVELKNSLANLIASHLKGEEIMLTIIRAGKEQKVKVEL